MGIFGWSLPPGVTTLPGEEPDEPIDLRDERTIKGYGRKQHGLNGKDADLDDGGQVYVNSAWWHGEDGKIELEGRYYVSLCPAERYDFITDPEREELTPGEEAEYDDYLHYCQQIVYDTGWTDEDWTIGDSFYITAELDWDNDKTDAENINAACAKAYEAITENAGVKRFQDAMEAASNAMQLKTWRELTAGLEFTETEPHK